MSCVVCGGINRDETGHHCPPGTINRIEGARKGWEDRDPVEPSYNQRIRAGFYLLQCGEHDDGR